MLLFLLVVVWLFVGGFVGGGYLTTFNFNYAAFILLSRLLLRDDKKLF